MKLCCKSNRRESNAQLSNYRWDAVTFDLPRLKCWVKVQVQDTWCLCNVNHEIHVTTGAVMAKTHTHFFTRWNHAYGVQKQFFWVWINMNGSRAKIDIMTNATMSWSHNFVMLLNCFIIIHTDFHKIHFTDFSSCWSSACSSVNFVLHMVRCMPSNSYTSWKKTIIL